ncbi:uncharacterized protein KRP23_9251 [Phytophthora ramorum]|uniref:uncharacterized protein n=1 Tax=Phytophthora ramorum TaxID=164328 RepID=UPI0030B6C7D3|nr:hypothetical protein KRP23_9251 [Phytophthora ramorum]
MIPVQEGPPVFELVPIEDLPAFDAAKTLKTMLLTQEQIRRVNAFRTRWKHVIAFMLQLGNLLMLLTTAAPRRVGSVMAVLAPILQFPGMMLILGSMRIGMLYLLLGTYDFWYFTINNLIFGMCFSAMLLDIRVIVVVVGCVIVQISIGADALVGDRSQILLSSVINCGTHFAMFIAVFLKVVDDNGRGDTFILAYSSSGYGFSIRDTLMNTQLNMILLFGRLVYRNWVAVREQDSVKVRRINSLTSYIPGRRRCVSYYCTVGLRPKSNTVQSSSVRARSVLVLGALAAWISKDQNLDNLRPGLARTQKMAFVASLVFCGVFFASYQRQLLKRLYSSFNFLFLSTKLTVASLALCQFFVWDRRVVWVWGAWLWMQWAITLDALPPSAMRLLAFRRSTLMLLVLIFELTGLIVLSLELFALDRWIVPNRAVVDRVILGRHIQESVYYLLVV